MGDGSGGGKDEGGGWSAGGGKKTRGVASQVSGMASEFPTLFPVPVE